MARARARTHTKLRGLLHPGMGPLVRVALRGPRGDGSTVTGLAVIDTGASMSAVDRGLARELQLESHGVATWFAVTGAPDERPIAPTRRGHLMLGECPTWWELDLIEVPHLAESIAGYRAVVLLGWDFLSNCRVELDGPSGTFLLELPLITGSGRRRR